MPPSPSEFFFRRKPFMQRTVRDDLVGLFAGLVGFAAGYLLIGDDQSLVLAFFVGVGVLTIAVQGVIRHVIRQRRDAASRIAPPD